MIDNKKGEAKQTKKATLTLPWTRNRRENGKYCEANDTLGSESKSMRCYPTLQFQRNK